MTDAEMKDKLEILILKYVKDKTKKNELLSKIDPYKVKYVLGEIDRVRVTEYAQNDLNVIKEIYFYYC